MEEIIRILMRRDNISEIDAMRLVIDTRVEINEVIGKSGSLSEIEDILMYNLGLEPDYIMNFL